MANTLSSDQGPQLSVSIWRLRFRAFKGDHAAVFGSLVLFCMACLCAMVGWIELALEVSGVETDLLTRFEPITLACRARRRHWLYANSSQCNVH